MIISVECGCDQLRTYGELTKPEALTMECPALMIMSGVGSTYMMGGALG